MDSGRFDLMRLSSYEMQGSSGDEMDSTQELQNNTEVPNGLEVIPLNMQDHYLDRIKVRSTEQLLSEIAKMQGPPQELEIKDGTVFTHKFLHRGTKYGPYTVKYTDQPVDRQFAWEVVAGSTIRGWLEPIPESAMWLKHIRTVYSNIEANIYSFIVAGYIWYEVTRDIPAGTELVAAPKVPLQLRDIFSNGPQDDRSDRETGSQHSGTNEEDFTSNDLENSKQENTDKEQDTDDEEGLDCKCVVCDRQCQDIDQLDDHLVTTHHYRKDAFRCDIFPKSYCYRPSLLRHRALVHGELRKYPCKNCTKDERECDHLNLEHSETRNYKCDLCGSAVKSIFTLRKHFKRIHMKIKSTESSPPDIKFECQICKKYFASAEGLKKHELRYHSDSWAIVCNVCGKKSLTTAENNYHMKIHSFERKFQCEFCDLRFARYEALKTHSIKHKGEWSYKCGLCAKIFKHSSSVSGHRKSHKVNGFYYCGCCDARFTDYGQLKHHFLEAGHSFYSQVKEEINKFL